MIKISESEKLFIIDGIQQNVRTDGRTILDFRPFSIETGIVPQTNGSARIKLSNTDILVSVKVEVGEPDPDFPDQGRLQVHVECSPSASPAFEGRGAEQVNSQLTVALRNILSNSFAIDWKKLCITEGAQCWVLYVDCLVLDSEGNLFDALSIAVKSALYNTRIPKIKVIELENGDKDIEVNDDLSQYEKLDTTNIPVSITLGKIGKYYLMDPSVEEELCMQARVTVGVNAQGNVCSVQKGSVIGAATSCGINPSELNKMIQSARQIGLALLKQLDALLSKEEAEKSKMSSASLLMKTLL